MRRTPSSPGGKEDTGSRRNTHPHTHILLYTIKIHTYTFPSVSVSFYMYTCICILVYIHLYLYVSGQWLRALLCSDVFFFFFLVFNFGALELPVKKKKKNRVFPLSSC